MPIVNRFPAGGEIEIPSNYPPFLLKGPNAGINSYHMYVDSTGTVLYNGGTVPTSNNKSNGYILMPLVDFTADYVSSNSTDKSYRFEKGVEYHIFHYKSSSYNGFCIYKNNTSDVHERNTSSNYWANILLESITIV